MYATALIRYRKPFPEVEPFVAAHREYLRALNAAGILLASGPMEPRTGGVLLLRVPDDDVLGALDRVRDGDPFTHAGVAQYELIAWSPVIGAEALEKL